MLWFKHALARSTDFPCFVAISHSLAGSKDMQDFQHLLQRPSDSLISNSQHNGGFTYTGLTSSVSKALTGSADLCRRRLTIVLRTGSFAGLDE
jgi:hypothetical protein